MRAAAATFKNYLEYTIGLGCKLDNKAYETTVAEGEKERSRKEKWYAE